MNITFLKGIFVMTEEQTPQEQPSAPQQPQQTPEPAEQAAPQAVETDKDARTMAMLCHLLGLFTCFIGPLILWIIKKDEYPFVDEQGKEALNFQITILLASIVAGLSMLICIGIVLLPALGIVNLIFCIIATVKANSGEHYRYPVCLRLIK
jgi:uncharacterized Tic20 family protein